MQFILDIKKNVKLYLANERDAVQQLSDEWQTVIEPEDKARKYGR